MRVEQSQRPPLVVSPADYEAGKRWVIALYAAYETKEIHRIKEFMDDMATLQLSSLPPMITRSQKLQWLSWHISSLDKLEHIIHSVNVLPNQIIMDYDAVYYFPTGEMETVPCITTIEKSTKSPKSSGFIVSGDMSKVIEKCVAQGGPPPFNGQRSL